MLTGALPDAARVWLFATAEPLAEPVRKGLLADVEAFLQAWASHGRPVRAEAGVLEGQVLAVAALITEADLNAGVSGCGIDQMERAVAGAFERQAVRRLGPLDVAFHDGTAWRVTPRATFRQAARSGEVSPETPTLDLTPTTLGALRAGGVARPAGETWLRAAFGPVGQASPG